MSLRAIPLQSLKVAQLKRLGVQCGINTGGNKDVLAARLVQDAQDAGTTTGPARIASIDMGIRNLAYCVFDTRENARASPTIQSEERIIGWKRISVSPKSEEIEQVKESFEPAIYASHAYDFVSNVLLPFEPTHILIERQRYRSMGAAAIQEWTVRVNMFEGMLHSVLRTLKSRGHWAGNVESVSPARQTSFWIGDGDVAEKESTKVRRAKGAKARSKGAKVDLVAKWLQEDDTLAFEKGQAQRTRDAFLHRWSGAGRRGSKQPTVSKSDDVGKLDDLADCLLQGLAYIKWQQNRRLLATGQLESLLAS